MHVHVPRSFDLECNMVSLDITNMCHTKWLKIEILIAAMFDWQKNEYQPLISNSCLTF